jgi:hypothetical protein
MSRMRTRRSLPLGPSVALFDHPCCIQKGKQDKGKNEISAALWYLQSSGEDSSVNIVPQLDITNTSRSSIPFASGLRLSILSLINEDVLMVSAYLWICPPHIVESVDGLS